MRRCRNLVVMIIAITAAALLIAPSPGGAQVREIITEGIYSMGDGETPLVAESRALLQAKRKAIEYAGTYVESYSKVNKITLTKDEIHVVASGLMEVEILEKKRTIIKDGIRFWVRIRATVDPDHLEEMARNVKEFSISDDYKRMQDAFATSRQEIEELKEQLAAVKGEKERGQVKERIVHAERWFQARDWLEQGKYYLLNRETEDALVSASVAILLNPKDPDAYVTRGIAYMDRGQHDEAIGDFTAAVALNPDVFIAYYNRGCSHYINGDFDKAAEDYTKSIELKPHSVEAFVSRGRAYSRLGNTRDALSDFRAACTMGSKQGCEKLQAALQENGAVQESGRSKAPLSTVRSPSGETRFRFNESYHPLNAVNP